MTTSAPPQRINRLRSLAGMAVLVIVLLGSLLRILAYATNRSLWFDEALLVLNIVSRPWPELMRPLANDQGAPIGFLLAEKALVEMLNKGEFVLRLLPLAAGIAALPLVYWVARRCLSLRGALLALSLFAVNEYAIYYASEAKQYSTDVFVALVLYATAVPILKPDTQQRGYLVLWGGLGALALWFSHPSVFVVAGIALTVMADILRRRCWRRLWAFALCGVLWASSFAVLYLVSLRDLSANQSLIAYWQAYFMPMPPWQDWAWFASVSEKLLSNPVGLSAPWLLPAVLGAAGLVALTIQNWRWAMALATPLLLILAASGLHRYPFGQRLMLFSVPTVLIFVVAGVDQVRAWLHRSPVIANTVWIALAAILLYSSATTATQNAQTPVLREHVRPLLEELQTNWQPGDVLYVYNGAQPALAYYALLLNLDTTAFQLGTNHRTDPAHYLPELDALRGKNRVWIVFSHIYDWGPVDERKYLLDHLDQIGQRQAEFWGSGASLHLYNLAVPPPASRSPHRAASFPRAH